MRQQDAKDKKKATIKQPVRVPGSSESADKRTTDDQECESEDSVPRESKFVSRIEFEGAMDTFDESIKQMQTAMHERQEQLALQITQQHQQSQENNAKLFQQHEQLMSHMNQQHESFLGLIQELKQKVGTSFREVDQTTSEQTDAYTQLVSDMQGISQSILAIQNQLHSVESINQLSKSSRDESRESPIFQNSDTSARKLTNSRQSNQFSSSTQREDLTFSFTDDEEGTRRDSAYGSLLAGDIEL